ncbi:hypothetical protein BU15DRAFT_66143 [Melanogaster broomeanus]|nr:hypothetical protein BU15DRAFT_66143 [Melanogaster broomeanus]
MSEICPRCLGLKNLISASVTVAAVQPPPQKLPPSTPLCLRPTRRLVMLPTYPNGKSHKLWFYHANDLTQLLMSIILDDNDLELVDFKDIKPAVGEHLCLIDGSVHNDCLEFWKLLKAEATVQEDRDILTDMNECENYLPLSSKNTPSQATKSSKYLSIQSGDQKIFDARWTADGISTIAPPIQLAFTYFSSKAFDPEYDIPHDFIHNVWDLTTQFTCIHTSEGARGHHLQPLLQKMFSHPLTVPDALALSSHKDFPVYLIIGEEKNEFGNGG